jgi:hypothetical protein
VLGRAARADAQSISLQGPDHRAATITAAELAKVSRKTIHFDAHGDVHDYAGPLLIDILAKVGAPRGKDLHGRAMADAILVTAADGYQVVFGLAETDPGTPGNRLIIADRADGAPLAAKDGSLKPVAEGDLRRTAGEAHRGHRACGRQFVREAASQVTRNLNGRAS